jgi:NAD(P)-dependent dehydrogenase (short-subunit alcohol dehydrogenase family)
VLVNNAGIIMKNCCSAHAPEPDECSYEEALVTNQTNFFATLDLSNELFPLLKAHSRVVNVSSSCGK